MQWTIEYYITYAITHVILAFQPRREGNQNQSISEFFKER